MYAVFRSQNATGEVLLDAENSPVTVPWEVLENPSLTFDVGVVGKNGAGSIVIPTIWARVGRIVSAALASYMGPDDPSADIGAQIVEAARASAYQAEAAAVLSESWAVGGTDTRKGEDEDNAKYYAGQAEASATAAAADADRAEQSAAQAGYLFFNINAAGHLIYTRTDNADFDFELVNGRLVIYA